jgi:hypothetical protein
MTTALVFLGLSLLVVVGSLTALAHHLVRVTDWTPPTAYEIEQELWDRATQVSREDHEANQGRRAALPMEPS